VPNIPCPDKIDCQCADGSPFRNLSSEAPDVPTFLGIDFAAFIPPLGYQWDVNTCYGVCRSTVSQQAADLCAAEAAQICLLSNLHPPTGGPGSPPVPPPQPTRGRRLPVTIFPNNPQSCAVLCPDGLSFTYTVPANVFVARSQLQADTMAHSYACRQAQLHRICLSALTPDTVCVDAEYSATLTATGAFLALPGETDHWAIVDGELPPGLTFNGGDVQGGSVTITGTPTMIGVYDFTVQITTPSGDMMQKPYELVIAGITNLAGLPQGQVGTAYSYQLLATGFIGPVFSLAPGSNALPDGLSMDSAGLITGTPTTVETVQCIFQVTEP